MRGAYDSCLLRYSNESFVSVADLTVAIYSWDYNKVDYPASMNNTRWKTCFRHEVGSAHPVSGGGGTFAAAARERERAVRGQLAVADEHPRSGAVHEGPERKRVQQVPYQVRGQPLEQVP